MPATRIEGNLYVNGSLSSLTFTPPNASITNASIAAAAAIDSSKVIHKFPIRYTQSGGTAVVAGNNMLHTVVGATATIESIEAIIETPADDASRTIEIDLLAGNASSAFASVLSATVDFANTDAARTVKTGTISSASLTDGDSLKLTVAVAGGSGNQAQGLLVTVCVSENPN